ncbi:MAG: hypothetical protein Q7T74_02180 [Candidatus Saccharibacteria bacterium]|nr:hypothetical protein [Candidatus Saccharibacteria bacterium]
MLNQKPLLSIQHARRILGTASKKYSDEQLLRIINCIDTITDVVLENIDGSKIKRGVDIVTKKVHTGL